ncbi:sigma-E processing peptidase SpoIIGA [Sporosarcina sp. G11-34]|uniref:sigma-E processing peptidase SpoIIGA n=1 Tax=Sporosarcina sp. G11-34 TaxID=2849605 RepID=UPI0022A8D473|nr:sigma-E processing peptidase SpoIIGA [Sporosarcina sp. G11-34]MCZ2258864.1 sigma-E processing peptidase SpoIIGA [Sporosarcina sp. G11-34]
MYGEVIVGVNMLFNYAILSFANKIGNAESPRKRLVLASFVGAVPVTLFPTSSIVVIITFIGMTVCAFGRTFEPWKKSASMVLVGALFAGGMLTAFQYRIHTFNDWITVLTYAIIAYASLYYMRKKWLDVRIARHVSELSATSNLQIWGATIQMDVFVDTGNGCTEPLSGAPVHFVSLKAVEEFIPQDLKEQLLSWDPVSSPTLSHFSSIYHKDMRLVRLQTVQGRSWVVGFKFEQWSIVTGKTLRPGYIVLTKSDRRYPEGADAILHVSAMENLNQERGTAHAA